MTTMKLDAQEVRNISDIVEVALKATDGADFNRVRTLIVWLPEEVRVELNERAMIKARKAADLIIQAARDRLY